MEPEDDEVISDIIDDLEQTVSTEPLEDIVTDEIEKILDAEYLTSYDIYKTTGCEENLVNEMKMTMTKKITKPAFLKATSFTKLIALEILSIVIIDTILNSSRFTTSK